MSTIAQDQLCSPLGDGDHWRVGVAAGQQGHHGGIHHPQTSDPVDPQRRIDHRLGRGPDHPMSRDEMWDKFSDCAGRVLSPDRILGVFEQLNTFCQLSQISAVTEAIEGAWSSKAAAAE